ncbi:MAG: PAS domain-containing protein [Rickettsiales bacterium]|jgi:hypothetical protein
MNENRLTTRLTEYWNDLKQDDVIPDFEQNNPALIGDLWDQCFVLYIIPPNYSAYRYEYLGAQIKEMYGRDLTGTFVDLKNRQFLDAVIIPRLQVIRSVLNLKTPQEDSGQLPTKNKKFIKYRIVLLPFGSESAGTTHIVVGVSFREF